MNKSFLSVLALMLCFGLYSNAQELEIVSSAGTEASSSSASISYTVGELVVATGTSSSSVLTQGYHQGFLTPTAIDEVPAELELTLFPNPTSDFLIIEAADLSKFDVMNMYDVSGRMVWSKEGNPSTQNRMEINFQSFASGNYILRLIDSDADETYSYNIVKSH